MASRSSLSIVAVTALLAGLSASCSSGTHLVYIAKIPSPERRSHDWSDVFAHPTDLRVIGFRTGEVFTGTKILIEDSPNTPPELKSDRWVPAISYLVEHPTRGRLLLDTGVTRSSPANPGVCSYGFR